MSIAYTPPRELFHIGNFTVYSWGTIFVIGFLVAFFLTLRQAKKKGLDSRHIYNIALILLLATLIGARLFHIFENLAFYINKPAEIFALSHGGLTSHGAFLSLLFVWLYTRKQKLSFLMILDLIIPYVILAMAITRVGCFLNWCCYGQASNLPWALKVGDDVARHPTQLYESITYFFSFWILTRLRSLRELKEKAEKYKKTKLGSFELLHQKELVQKPGFLFLSFLILYSAFRFAIDFLREYSSYWLDLALSQWIGIAIALFSVIMLLRKS